MKVTLDDVKTRFDQLVKESASLEEIADWAHKLRSSDDNEPLVYEPPEAREVIWNALIYLEGVDLRISPDEYLHCVEDFELKKADLGFV